jgi:gliding motility-associated-like protein
MKNIIITILLVSCGFALSAQFYYNETCRNTTGIFNFYGDAPGYTAALGIDQPGDGWLRLTNTAQGQKGYVVFANTFPSYMGVTIEFDFKVWAASDGPFGKADGFSVFLFDGNPALTFSIGQSGGALGYGPDCQNCGQTGLANAYLGVGIDEYGNFSSTWNGACCAWTQPSGSQANSIVLRSGASTGYTWLASTGPNLGSLNAPILYSQNTSTRPDDNIYYRRVRIDIVPNGTGGMQVDAYVRISPMQGWNHIFGPIQMTDPVPALFGMGFAGVTGGGWAYHEVRDMIARTPGDLYVRTQSDPCPFANDTIRIIDSVANFIGPLVAVEMIDTFPPNFILYGTPVVSDPALANLYNFTQTTISSGQIVCEYLLDLNGNGAFTVTHEGTFAPETEIDSFYTSVTIIPPGGDFIDFQMEDNWACQTIKMSERFYIEVDACDSTSIVFGNRIIIKDGVYTDSLQNTLGCDSIVYLTIRFHPIDWMELGANQMWCLQDTSYIELSTTGNFEAYQWSNGATTPTITVTESGVYTLTVINDLGCERKDSVEITFVPTPEVKIFHEPEDFCGETGVNLLVKTDSLAEIPWEVKWSTGDNTENIEIEDIGFYSVTVSDRGCINSDTIEIKFCCPEDIGLPNVITPSTKDGINDFFQFKEGKNFPNVDLNIYNKWGKKVFHSQDTKFQWDGTVSGKLEGGTYFWVLDLDKGCQFHGSITVL